MKVGKEEWDRIKKRLRAELGEDVFSSWFASVEFEDEQNGLVILSVSTRFLKSWIQSHYGGLADGRSGERNPSRCGSIDLLCTRRRASQAGR